MFENCNSFINSLKDITNYKYTENGAVAHKATNSAVYDMFALGGTYRKRSEADCILLFKNAIEEDEIMALKCLFYLRDVRGGQGERRFFRVCFKWLCDNNPEAAKRNLGYLSEYGRWDDLIYATAGTKLEDYALFLIKEQLVLDMESKTPSLLAKWLPSENASSHKTRKMAIKVRTYLKMTHKEYRKALAELRKRINIVERLMSENRWDEIEFDKIPSKAGLIYKNAFARRDIIAKKYETFAKDKDTKVNAKTLFPYEVVNKVTNNIGYWNDDVDMSDTDRKMVEKYWENLPDYLKGEACKIMTIIDTSGSMDSYNGSTKPIDVALSLGMYCAERIGGPFKDYFITFSQYPELIKFEGVDFADKVARVYRRNQCENTNLPAVFDMLKNMILKDGIREEDIPTTLIVISDMEIDSGSGSGRYWYDDDDCWTKENTATEMEKIRQEWAKDGLILPHLVYWNVDARDNTILDSGPNVSFVSGCTPVLFEQIIRGVKGIDIMYEKLMSERYAVIG